MIYDGNNAEAAEAKKHIHLADNDKQMGFRNSAKGNMGVSAFAVKQNSIICQGFFSTAFGISSTWIQKYFVEHLFVRGSVKIIRYI